MLPECFLNDLGKKSYIAIIIVIIIITIIIIINHSDITYEVKRTLRNLSSVIVIII